MNPIVPQMSLLILFITSSCLHFIDSTLVIEPFLPITRHTPVLGMLIYDTDIPYNDSLTYSTTFTTGVAIDGIQPGFAMSMIGQPDDPSTTIQDIQTNLQWNAPNHHNSDKTSLNSVTFQTAFQPPQDVPPAQAATSPKVTLLIAPVAAFDPLAATPPAHVAIAMQTSIQSAEATGDDTNPRYTSTQILAAQDVAEGAKSFDVYHYRGKNHKNALHFNENGEIISSSDFQKNNYNDDDVDDYDDYYSLDYDDYDDDDGYGKNHNNSNNKNNDQQGNNVMTKTISHLHRMQYQQSQRQQSQQQSQQSQQQSEIEVQRHHDSTVETIRPIFILRNITQNDIDFIDMSTLIMTSEQAMWISRSSSHRPQHPSTLSVESTQQDMPPSEEEKHTENHLDESTITHNTSNIESSRFTVAKDPNNAVIDTAICRLTIRSILISDNIADFIPEDLDDDIFFYHQQQAIANGLMLPKTSDISVQIKPNRLSFDLRDIVLHSGDDLIIDCTTRHSTLELQVQHNNNNNNNHNNNISTAQSVIPVLYSAVFIGNDETKTYANALVTDTATPPYPPDHHHSKSWSRFSHHVKTLLLCFGIGITIVAIGCIIWWRCMIWRNRRRQELEDSYYQSLDFEYESIII